MHRFLVLVLIAGCFDPNFQQGVPCSIGGVCPEGQFCAEDNRCYDEGSGPSFNSDATLESLLVSHGELEPPFDSTIEDYELVLPLGVKDIVLTPKAAVPDGVIIDIAGESIASGASTSPIALVLGPNSISIEVSPEVGEHRTYSVAAVRGPGILQEVYIKSSNSERGDSFGGHIALDGDTLVVGATGEDSASTFVGGDQSDNSAPNSGAAYVFVREGDTWIQQAYLKASNADADDGFGGQVQIDGDTIAIGAHGEASSGASQGDNSAENAGAVYVFVRNGQTWSQQAYLKASNAEAGDQFGVSLGLSGDTIAVGANAEDSEATGINGDEANNGASTSGAVYVFGREGTSWSQQAYVKASNTEAEDSFGRHVALSGNALAVGATGEDSNAVGIDGDESDNSAELAGAVYLFERTNEGWQQVAYVKASNTGASDGFGGAIALSGDTLAISASGEASSAKGVDGNQNDNSATSAGAIYVFVRSGAKWAQQAYLKASNTTANLGFGAEVALDGDVLVGASIAESSSATGINGDQEDQSAQISGAAYLFTRSGNAWSQQAYIKASNTNAFDQFGRSVAVSNATVIVSSSQEGSSANGIGGGSADQNDNSAGASGAVYVFQ